MAALFIVAAAAAGPVTPTSDNARRQPGVRGQGKVDGLDSATAGAKSPLLYSACHCSLTPGCLACARWRRHERTVRARRSFWAREGWL